MPCIGNNQNEMWVASIDGPSP